MLVKVGDLVVVCLTHALGIGEILHESVCIVIMVCGMEIKVRPQGGTMQAYLSALRRMGPLGEDEGWWLFRGQYKPYKEGDDVG